MGLEESSLIDGLFVQLLEIGGWPFEKGTSIGEIFSFHLIEIEIMDEQIEQFLQKLSLIHISEPTRRS